jgi:nitrogen regulatory protein PII
LCFAIRQGALTGKIFVVELSAAMRVRTGEAGDDSL